MSQPPHHPWAAAAESATLPLPTETHRGAPHTVQPTSPLSKRPTIYAPSLPTGNTFSRVSQDNPGTYRLDLSFSTEPLKSEEVNSEVLLEQALALYRIGETSDTIDAADFVAIDWGTKARDWLLTAYPQLRDAKLRTNSLNLALNNLQSEGGVAVLPIHVEKQLPQHIKVTKIKAVENVSLKVYVHSMKQVRRVGLAEIIDSVSTAY